MAFSRGEKTFGKEQLLNRLTIVYNIIQGCGYVLPFLDGKVLKLVDSVTDMTPLQFIFRPK